MEVGRRAPESLVELLWDRPREFYRRGRPLSDKQHARLTVSLEVDGARYVAKTYIERSWRHGLKACILPSRARRAWIDTRAVLAAGVRTPSAVGWREQTLLGVNFVRSYFVYEFLEGETVKAAGLRLLKTFPPDEAFRRLRPVIEQVTEIYRRLSLFGLVLHDPDPSNFVLDRLGNLWVIDVDKLERPRGVQKIRDRRRVMFRNFWRRLAKLGILERAVADDYARRAAA